MPESPRWLEARERRDQARKVVERMEARVMKRHPVLPEPDLTPYEVVAEEKTSLVGAVRQAVRGRHRVPAGGHGARLRRHRVRRREPGSLFLTVNRGYSAGFIFALAAWAGVVATAIYLLNAFFGERLERRWTQLVGAILFAGGWLGHLQNARRRGRVHLLHRCR